MTPQTSLCLLVIIALLMASMVLQFIRGRMRKSLVRKIKPDMLTSIDRQKWQSIGQGLDFLFGDYRKLRLVKCYAATLPADLQEELRSYRRLSRIEIAVTTSLFIFAALAYRFCS
jgi:hypothetical protein